MIGSGAFVLWKGSYLTAGFLFSVIFSFTLSFQVFMDKQMFREKIIFLSKYPLSSCNFFLLELNIISL